jgi:hypothetical protein
MIRLAIFLGALLLVGCADSTQPLRVKQFQLRDQATGPGEEPMVKMEKERRLLGAVSMAERRQRLGQYYTLLWNDPSAPGQEGAKIIFQYQQGASASRIKRMVKSFPTADSHGTAEFAVIGSDYFDNGKVLAWKATLQRGKRVVATRQSYLWQ